MSALLRFSLSAAAVAAFAAVCVLGAEHANAVPNPGPPTPVPPVPPFPLVFPTGQVCKNSAVTVTSANNGRVTGKTFTRPDGTVVMRVVGGPGPDLTFVNPNHPNVTFTTNGNGSVHSTATQPDGSVTLTTTGHNIIFYFPTDTLLGGKPGPATLLVVGREVINVGPAPDSKFTQVSETGNVTDICAKLPPD